MHIPLSTYRVQFNGRFTFRHLANIADYLEDLGITAIYASPLLQPTRGSDHGYDGINPAALNPELGTLEEMETLSALLRKKSIGWIQDIVPNHLAFNTSNVWLADVLERGQSSPYADYFDIDWEHPFYEHKLMVPFLELELNECLLQQKIKLELKDNGFVFSYGEYNYPANPDSYPFLLSGSYDEENNNVNAATNALIHNKSLDIEQWTRMKADLLTEIHRDDVFDKVIEKIEMINNDPNILREALLMQHYVLCVFTQSHVEINYRRFFNVNGLICLRIEEEKVFNEYHRLTHEMYQKGLITGLRVDHIDGLKRPVEYINRLRQLFGKDCYIIVEKILDVKEELPEMDIEGTSGYEFLSYINQLVTDNRGSEKLLEIYHDYVPGWSDFDTIVFDNKLSNLESYLNGEWDNLLRLLLSLNLVDDQEIRLQPLKLALGAFMAAYPVYRAYVEELPMSDNDEQLVSLAFERALNRYPNLHYELSVLKQVFQPHPDITRNTNRLAFVQRLMQFTGPMAAKGVEDTTFYQYNPLISHNEVGDSPCRLGITVQEFHEKMETRSKRNPYSMNCTSTHDTKRGEDGRIRINIISEMAAEWQAHVEEWQKMNEPYRQQVGDLRAPVLNDEYFLYQAILGGFPEDLELTEEFVTRTKTYFIKVLRESKRNSDHILPNTAYEQACMRFIEHLLNPKHSFLPSIKPFIKKIIPFASIYSMVQTIIKITAPGIPDIYRGCELWDISYVDPDNRRTVDYILRQKLVNELIQNHSQDHQSVLNWANQNFELGTQKLYVTRALLRWRREHRELFLDGEYIPVYSEDKNRSVIAYLRKHDGDWLLVVLPLGIVSRKPEHIKLKLPDDAPTKWENILTGEEIDIQEAEVENIFKLFPVAALRPLNN